MALSINLRVAERLVVIVGGGPVAARRAATLLSAGAHLHVIAPQFCSDVRALEGERVKLIARSYQKGDLAQAFIAIAATDDGAVNATVCADASSDAILCNDVSKPERGNFTFPAAAQYGRITLAVDTAGASPALSKKLLRQLGATIDPRAAQAAETLDRMRAHAAQIEDGQERRRILAEAADLPLDTLAGMSAKQAAAYIEREGAPHESVTCASRGSRLALAQAASITGKLQSAGIHSQILTIATRGDLSPDRPLSEMNAENIFVKEIESALLDGRADYAVHSCKDLPSTLEPELQLVAISVREDARDAFCSERFESFADLPSGARIGTSSIRRRAQLRALRSDLDYVNCRGNVDTRLRKLRDGEYDAIVLAMAGLRRLESSASHTAAFEAAEIVPAVGQGALAIEMRAGESELQKVIRRTVNDERAELAIICERAALAALGGGCNAPIGIHAHYEAAVLHAIGIVCSNDGSQTVSARTSATVADIEQASGLGARLASQLLISGGGQLLGSTCGGHLPLAGRVILLPRTQTRDSQIAPALEGAGARVIQVRDTAEALQALAEQSVDMVVFPSSGTVDTIGEMFRTWRVDATRPAIAAMGPSSANAATKRGVAPDVVAHEPTIESLSIAIRRYFEGRVLAP
ncbi:MAG: hydroxymethylbilane synthase [Candidatus Eremiobacteraeota bacterium]|nr:hydroxymethylbilane synthase [Candidatus Eremiobacteraeota bacterium]